MKSKGFLKDLGIMYLALGTMKVPIEHKKMSIRHDANKNHKENNKIDRRIINLYDKGLEISETIAVTIEEKKWLKSFQDKLLRTLVKHKFSNKPSYEYLGTFLLYLNFIDGRKQKLDDKFSFINNKIFDVSTMIESIGVEDNGEEYQVAKSVIELCR